MAMYTPKSSKLQAGFGKSHILSVQELKLLLATMHYFPNYIQITNMDKEKK